MRKMKLLVLPLLLALIAGCGGGGGGSSQPQHAPTISNLQYTPQSATLNQDGGLINVTGTLDFNDIDGNLSTLTINIYDSNGTPLAPPTTSQIQGASGVTSGTIGIVVAVNTTVAGSYSFGIHVTDSIGLQSNVIMRTFIVS